MLVAASVALGAVAAAPTAITGSVSAVGGTSATVNGTVNPGGAATDWWFEYGTSTSYGSKLPATTAAVRLGDIPRPRAANCSFPVREDLPLPPGRQERDRERQTGGDGLFTTAAPPVVVTSPATGVGPTTATLGGTVNPNGEPTRVRRIRHLAVVRHEDGGDRPPARGQTPKAVSTRVSGLTPARPTTSAASPRSAGPSAARTGRS